MHRISPLANPQILTTMSRDQNAIQTISRDKDCQEMLLKLSTATVWPMKSANLDGFDIGDADAVDVKGV